MTAAGFGALLALALVGWAWVWTSEAYHRRGVVKHRAEHPELFGEYESSPYQRPRREEES